KFTQAFMSEEQLLVCTIATKSPEGVVTKSISGWTFFNFCSKTIIAKAEVPAETLPVFLDTLFVAVIPVPASPSGGQIGIPAFKLPEGSNNLAPSTVNKPA